MKVVIPIFKKGDKQLWKNKERLSYWMAYSLMEYIHLEEGHMALGIEDHEWMKYL